MAKVQKIIKKSPVKLNMTFEKAMSKALSTPLPPKKKAKKKS
jgi:hypothetical protein